MATRLTGPPILDARKILKLRPKGLYCEAGDFYIDPVRKVPRAVITHGHADHARPGHEAVLATQATIDVMKARYGQNCAQYMQPLRYGETIKLGEVTLSFLPAGHVLGSAQACIEVGASRVIVSGDYKRGRDPTCTPFEPKPCDVFVTEATFGLPVFQHPSPELEIGKLLESLKLFPERAHHVAAYSLGKAQRLLALLRQEGYDEPVFVDRSTAKLCELYEHHDVKLGQLTTLGAGQVTRGRLVIAPPSARNLLEDHGEREPITSFASGWMRVQKRARNGGGDLPLIISDHADWPELTRTIQEIDPAELWITHGEEAALMAWTASRGIQARPLSIAGYGNDADGHDA
jgi:putative mRNA 3-end processing factor